MDIYKQRFTSLQNGMLRFLFVNSGASFNQRAIAKKLNVSPTAISKSLNGLEKEELIKVKKDKETKRILIELNNENSRITGLKRAENLKMFYESGLSEFLSEDFPGCTIILFGSYSRGDDSTTSDIDIAIIGTKEKNLDLKHFEDILNKKIIVQFYPNFKEIHKNLRENLCNGILIKGGIEL